VTAQQCRELLIDAASASDFGVFERLDAERISFLPQGCRTRMAGMKPSRKRFSFALSVLDPVVKP
jgi:hypothetical protein